MSASFLVFFALHNNLCFLFAGEEALNEYLQTKAVTVEYNL